MTRRKTVWGKPGETGVSEDGIPWYVPEDGPGFMSRMLYRFFPGGGTYMPAGARFLPARTAAEVQERIMPRYAGGIAKLLDDSDTLAGFAQFSLDENVPQPPQSALEAKAGPNPLKHWWMGGGWDTMAGQLLVTIGSSRTHDHGPRTVPTLIRHQVWVRTSRRIVIMDGYIDNPHALDIAYGPDQVGIRPGWQPGDPARGEPGSRVDIAFADGSWLGVQGITGKVPGGTEGYPDRDLLAELAGPPVTSTVLPARGRG